MELVTVTTPGGNAAKFWCREGTNDRMTVEVDIEQDRYGIGSLVKGGGLHIDIGAHIGTWIIGVLLDDPDATGIAVESLPENIKWLNQNLEDNGLTGRVEIVKGAFAKRGPVKVHWGFKSKSDPERASMHRYIGGFNLDLMPDDVEYKTERAKAITPSALIGGHVAVLKVAGETAEQALGGSAMMKCSTIIGKYHSAKGRLAVEKLAETHDLAIEDDPDFGWYRAEL